MNVAFVQGRNKFGRGGIRTLEMTGVLNQRRRPLERRIWKFTNEGQRSHTSLEE